MRKLASIRKILNIEPIVGADRIEKATIDGWKCVIKKDEFKIGDLCVYFEIDSVLPNVPDFEFMESRGYKVKTAKFKKQISQGLVMPLSILNNFGQKILKVKEGDDVTEIIGVVKHDPQAEKEERIKENAPKPMWIKYMLRYSAFRWLYRKIVPPKTLPFPEFIPKTDEERIQNIPNIFTEKEGTVCYVTEKLDGQSATYALYKGKFYVCSRNIHLNKENSSTWWEVAKTYNIKNKLLSCKNIIKNVAIQGEIIGPTVQDNKYSLRSRHYFFVFNVYDIDKRQYLSNSRTASFCKTINIGMVPLIDIITLSKDMTVDQLVDISKGNSCIASIKREGIVLRNDDKGVSFKAINPDFLLGYKQ